MHAHFLAEQRSAENSVLSDVNSIRENGSGQVWEAMKGKQ
jgi:hypothetical protein